MTLPRDSHASACGKVIIVGEHAAVYGAPAIALPLLHTRMQASLFPLDPVLGAKTTIYLGGRPAPSSLLPLVDKAFEVLGLRPFPVLIRGQSQIRAGAGLGSSAALCVALLRLLCASVSLTLTPQTLASYGNELEKHFHGTPSGLDAAVVAFEQIIHFQKREPQAPNSFRVLPLGKLPSLSNPQPSSSKGAESGEPWRFVLVDSLEHSPTYKMIELVRPAFRGEQGLRRLSTFARLAEDVETGLGSANLMQVAEAMNEACRELDGCGIITPTMAHLIARGKELGAIAAKPTGAGGGGNILLLLRPEGADKLLTRMRKEFSPHPLAYLALNGR